MVASKDYRKGPKNQEAPWNSIHPKGDKKEVTYWGLANIRHRCTQYICLGDLKPGTCATLNYGLLGCDVMQVGIQELEFQMNMLPQTGTGKYRPREERPGTTANVSW